MKLVRDVLGKEPHLFCYFQSPFLVKALYALGAVEMDAFVRQKHGEATYKRYQCHWPDRPGKRPVKVAILTSMVKEYDVGPKIKEFSPNEDMDLVVKTLKKEILERVREALPEAIRDRESASSGKFQDYGVIQWRRMAEESVAFCTKLERPMVIYPDNAETVIGDVCPDADFTVILLGKNIYLSIDFDEETDDFPRVPWMYLDVMDIQYEQAREEIEAVGRFIGAKIVDRL
jgi:hypothetical protein